MRIAFLSLMAGSPWAASEILWAQAAQRALDEGHQVLVSVYDWSPCPAAIEELEHRGALIERRPLGKWIRRSALLTRLQRSFRRLEAFRPDVICVSQGGTYDIGRGGSISVLRNMLQRLDSPYLLLCHCEQPRPRQRNLLRTRTAFDHAAAVGFVAQRAREVAEVHLGTPIPNARIFHNPVNLQQLENIPWPAQPEPLRLAFVGRLEPVKNLESLIAALATRRWSERNWLLTIYGTGSQHAPMEQLVRQRSLSHHVQFAGHVADMTAVWAINHALILPSKFEGVPLAMIEAMICGRPVVATDTGGIREWLEDGSSGFLIRRSTPPDIDTALEQLWEQREQLERMGQVAREHTLARRDSDPAGTLLGWIQQAARS